ncbi:hypothetical protein Y1Q_0013827 [Alligator mississippiensis]|uniref:Uncharacterized protein n=1 Tax=Alligator mississippiensis TaxID=8496 RepID=A0A151NFP9_ALLMI|nr:hypothetical protein Y1Q_0013827 [Alligator mississippiensis]
MRWRHSRVLFSSRVKTSAWPGLQRISGTRLHSIFPPKRTFLEWKQSEACFLYPVLNSCLTLGSATGRKDKDIKKKA